MATRENSNRSRQRQTGTATSAYEEFVQIVRRLRKECPWDREQTHDSVKHLLIEEAYEVVEAIDTDDIEELKKELGDVFLHVLFHSVIAEENGSFTLKDVIETETAKLIRRHPHVFGREEVDDAADVLENWEKIKQREDDDRTSVLQGVPARLPALLRAYRVQSKAAGVGFDFSEREGAWAKVEEELEELHEARREGPPEEVSEEFGDLLFALVNYARFLNINPENALRETTQKFTNRFQHIERRLASEGKIPDDVSLETMDRYWKEAKEAE
jgi:XTP/dITP diphosphohydrolase/tetrapyrrole methylase family protein/MazG family protein